MGREHQKEIDEAIKKYRNKNSLFSRLFGVNEAYIDDERNYTVIGNEKYRICDVDFGVYLYV